MTRINLVPPSELTDQHLFAEFREIKHVPHALARSIKARGLDNVLKSIPKEFTLGRGHVTFFYDKGFYLYSRLVEIQIELENRNYSFNWTNYQDVGIIPNDNIFWGNYTPTPKALALIRGRIAEKISLKPAWYRYYGQPCGR